MCVPGCVRAGVHRAAPTTMEALTRPDHLGHTSHLGVHLHLQQPYRHGVGPGSSRFLCLTLTFSGRAKFCTDTIELMWSFIPIIFLLSVSMKNK